MAFFSNDIKEMLDVYQSECSELMNIFDRLILSGEKKNSFTSAEINEIFRTAHSIKGSSAIMGLTVLSNLTHKMEDLFSIFRSDPQKIAGHVSEVLDLFFAYSDYVKGEIQRTSDENFVQRETPSLVQELQQAIKHFSGTGQMTAQEKAPSAVVEPDARDFLGSKQAVTLILRFAADCAMPNVRAVVILQQLSRKWKVLRHEPENLQGINSENTIKMRGLKISVMPEDVIPVKNFLAHNSYIISIEEQAVVAKAVAEQTQKTANTKAASEPDKALQEERFVNIRWEAVRALQDVAGGFVSQYSLLQRILQKSAYSRDLNIFSTEYRKLLDALLHHVSSLAMLRFANMAPQMYRTVRNISKQEHKDIEFTIVGENIEIDRNLYDNISKPIMHLVRNSLDHGIETPEERKQMGKPAKGKLVLTLENQGGRVVFRVTDDGRGMDKETLLAAAARKGLLKKPASQYTKQEALNLIMEPGFSTSQKVTNISGRGVGMDVVNTMANAYGGHVIIDSTPGRGTSVAVYMPVSLTAVDSLCFTVGEWLCYLPLYSLDKIYSANEAAEHLSLDETGRTILIYGKERVLVLDMRERLHVAKGPHNFYIVGHSLEQHFCIVVDEMREQLTAINKKLPELLDEEWQRKTYIINSVIGNDGSLGYSLSAALLSIASQGREENTL